MVSQVTQEDNIAMMSRYPDKFFDLAIVDPPYGIDLANMNMGVGKSKKASKIQNRKWVSKDWDVAPDDNYFKELFRVSKNQIIWGGNYFTLPTSQYFAVWDKGAGLTGRSFAECEYAWVGNGGTRIIHLNPVQKERFHPTQKPISLYTWLLQNYAKQGDKILDTHLGSGSSRIAAYDLGFDFYGCELDKGYFDASCKRFNIHIAQQKLFSPTITPCEQTTIF